MERHPKRLKPSELSAATKTLEASFSATSEVEPFDGILGQERAVNAIEFGVAMDRPGYNIYLMGENGTGRSSYVQDYLSNIATDQDAPSDWVYVNHFENPKEPMAIELPAGLANNFKHDLERFVDNLMSTFPSVFEHPTYQHNKNQIDRAFNQLYDKALDNVEREALRANIAVFKEAGTITFTPIREGKALDETEFAQLPDDDREEIHQTISYLEDMLNNELINLPQWRRESNEQLRKLNQATIDEAIKPLLKPLRKAYGKYNGVKLFLDRTREHLLKTVIDQLVEERILEKMEDAQKRALLLDQYEPNIMVSRSKDSGAPVIYESHPSYRNLFGRIEYTTDQGTLTTNYRQIVPGALHKANGGYLVIEADKLLSEPFVWDALKRSIKSRKLTMESPYSDMGLLSPATLSPDSLPLHVKIILIGSREVYYLLQDYDEEFRELFRVLVDFDERLPRTPTALTFFTQLLKSRVDEKSYRDLSQEGVARMVEYSSRLADNQRHLSARIGDIFELLGEAEMVRKLSRDALIDRKHIDKALAAKQNRTGRIADLILEEMLDGSVLIDTEGEAIGKINGLTVLEIGDSTFGTPARITAVVYPGSRGIVDIEREANLGQAIHSKGVMIMSGYMGGRYTTDFPLAMSASLAMEQSYGHIDGDSASLAELCCLLSSLTKTPIKQSMAMTGSMNQHGEVQAIGGVNEKIEGFFRLCEARGLTGDQGVIIPKSNVRNLMLDRKIVAAVEEGIFHIFAVGHADEALELLTGAEPGTEDDDGVFPENTFNRKVVDRLKELAEIEEGEEEDEEEEAQS
ncbi:Lon protease family protein [Litoribrevibacter albus]|uniref:endopeptidase La n=1 Tax=Litoribrevibacter albus TaxID=1473156 RepID=A0AA37W7C9_9GAMM|nr:ATP-binding protein [Litoribrevibacter albus]GLQ31228.1 ATP-dependent protease [Litoribrevibacter albus]